MNSPLLWCVLNIFGCPSRFLVVLRALHNGAMVRVVKEGVKSDPFSVTTGVCHGCVIAPVIFNLFMAAVFTVAMKQLDPADGVPFVYRLDGSLFKSAVVLEAACRRAGLIINTNKTEVMPMAGGVVEPLVVNINGVNSRNVNSFCYLGSTFNSSGNINDEIQRRIGLAAASFSNYLQRFSAAGISLFS